MQTTIFHKLILIKRRFSYFQIQKKDFGVHGLPGQSVHVRVVVMVLQNVNDRVFLVKNVQDIVTIPKNVAPRCVQVIPILHPLYDYFAC